ncbi:MAG: glycosyltransferase family 2 protein [Gemmatimonadota bacterium]
MADGSAPFSNGDATRAGGPLVSVILPTRNRAGLLERALGSALAQEAVAFEVLVVDDASTDDSPGLLAALAARDGRVRVLRQPERHGAAVARNRGAAEASAPFLAFLDDDDEWLPGKLQRQVDAAARSDAGVVSCRFAEVAADGTAVPAGRVDLGMGRARTTLARGNVLGLSATMVRRDVFRQVGGFDARLPRLQDWDLWIRLAAVASFLHVPDTLAVIHRSRDSISGDARALVRAAEILAAKHAPDASRSGPRDGGTPGLTAAEHADLLLSLARLLVRNGEDGIGRRLAVRALAAPPWSPRRVATGLLMSLAPGAYRKVTESMIRHAGGRRRLTPDRRRGA